MSYTHMQENSDGNIAEEDGTKAICKQLIGFTLGDAVNLAGNAGYEIKNISVSAPPKVQISEYDNSFRVLRVQALADKRLTVLICKPL